MAPVDFEALPHRLAAGAQGKWWAGRRVAATAPSHQRIGRRRNEPAMPYYLLVVKVFRIDVCHIDAHGADVYGSCNHMSLH